MRPASSFSPRPRAMEQSGAPPMPKGLQKAFKNINDRKRQAQSRQCQRSYIGIRPI